MGTSVPLLKYFVTVGTILIAGLFALSYALDPPTAPPPTVRSALLKPNPPAHQKTTSPKMSVLPAHRESKGNSASDGVEAPTPVSAPPHPSLVLEAAINGELSGVLSQTIPLPTPRPPVSDQPNNRAAPGDLARPVAGVRKVGRSKTARPQDVRRAYQALKTPYAPFYAFAPEPPRQVFQRF